MGKSIIKVEKWAIAQSIILYSTYNCLNNDVCTSSTLVLRRISTSVINDPKKLKSSVPLYNDNVGHIIHIQVAL